VKSGDRVSIDSKRVGQPRRIGTVERVTQGLSGTRYAIRWEDGHESIVSPQFGNLIVEKRGRGTSSARKAPVKAKSAVAKRSTAKRGATKNKAKAKKKGAKR
jgi:topoisomerase IA-like protein